MSDQPPSRGKAIAWWAALFILSVFGTAFVMAHWYHGRRLWLGVPLYTALFVCSSALGMRADSEKVRRGLGEGIRALIEPAPRWALAVLLLEIVIFAALGWSWFWRTTFPLPAGILAGFKWAAQNPPTDDKTTEKDGDSESKPAVDFWNP